MASQHVRSRQDMGSEIESISISFFSRAPPCADALSLPRLANFPHPFCSSQSPSKSLESAACVADACVLKAVSVYRRRRNLARYVSPTVCLDAHNKKGIYYTGMRRITTFRSTTDRIYDGGPIRL